MDIHQEIKENPKQLHKVIEKLATLDNAAELAKKKNRSWLPLHYAMEYGQEGVLDLVKLLVELHPEGVSGQTHVGRLPINLITGNNETDDWLKAFEFLLKKYPNGAKTGDKYGNLPIHIASNFGIVSALKLLLESYPEGAKTGSKCGNLPIHIASYCGNVPVLKLLLESYPDGAKTRDKCGDLPIHNASFHGNVPVLKLLLESYPEGAKTRDKRGNLPIHDASFYENVSALKLLLESYPEGAKVANKKGKLPINLAKGRETQKLLQDYEKSKETKKNRDEEKLKAQLVSKKNQCETDLEDTKKQYEQQFKETKQQYENNLAEIKERKQYYKQKLKEIMAQLVSKNKLASEAATKALKKTTDWSKEDLLSFAKLLDSRLVDLRNQLATPLTWSHDGFQALLRQSNPSQKHLLDSMDVIQWEIEKLQGTSSNAAGRDNALENSPDTTTSSEIAPSSETRPSKRAKVAVSPS